MPGQYLLREGPGKGGLAAPAPFVGTVDNYLPRPECRERVARGIGRECPSLFLRFVGRASAIVPVTWHDARCRAVGGLSLVPVVIGRSNKSTRLRAVCGIRAGGSGFLWSGGPGIYRLSGMPGMYGYTI